MNGKRVLLGAAIVAVIAMAYRTLTSDDTDTDSTAGEQDDLTVTGDDSQGSPASTQAQG